MTNNYTTDQNAAIRNFNLIKPQLERKLKCQFISIEANRIDNNEIVDLLDQQIGWDAISKDNETKLYYSYAVRIQPSKAIYNTFTIRYSRTTGTETEYSKRLQAIKHNAEYPKYTLQGYLYEANKLCTISIAKTLDLYAFIDANLDKIKIQTNSSDGNTFLIVAWDTLRNAGIDVTTHSFTY